MIKAEDLVTLFQQALSESWGYIWGTAGEKWTEAKQAALEKTTDDNRAQGRLYGKKWIGHTVADCSGLFTWAFRKLGGYMYHGSDTMYRKYCVNKGELKKGRRTDSAALKPGTAVFVWNGKKYSHVGLYVGNGTVVEAMGTVSGVTTTKVTATKWTHWGELTGVDYSGSQPQETETRKTVRRGSKGSDVKELQTLLSDRGYSVGPCGIDGDFGKDTEAAVRAFQRDRGLTVDGTVGKDTWTELLREPITGKTYTVTVSGLDRTQAGELQDRYPGSVIREE